VTFEVTYKGVRLTRVGISWYADVDGRKEWVGMSLAAAKRWVNTMRKALAVQP
jgi:hypothetical protein